MKVPALLVTLALASGVALAQTSPGTPAPGGTAPAMSSGQPAATTTEKSTAAATPKASTTMPKATAKKTKKAKAKKTQSMGAAAAPIETDLTAKDRRARMDAAYAAYQAAKGTPK